MTGRNKLTEFNPVSAGLIGAVFFEAVTCFFRFFLGMKSRTATLSTVGKLTMGIRIHHGYIGIILLLVYLISTRKDSLKSRIVYAGGLALFLSDLIHHFIVLYIATGSPEFDLFY